MLTRCYLDHLVSLCILFSIAIVHINKLYIYICSIADVYGTGVSLLLLNIEWLRKNNKKKYKERKKETKSNVIESE